MIYNDLAVIVPQQNGIPEAQMLRAAKMYGVEDLVTPTPDEKLIPPKNLLLALNANYKEGRVSFKKLSSLLAL